MNIIFLSQEYDGMPIAMHTQKEGIQTDFVYKGKTTYSAFLNGRGLLNKNTLEKSKKDKDTIFIFDTNFEPNLAEQLRMQYSGQVFGGGKLAYILEHERDKALELMKLVGIQIPEYAHFKSFKEGISYLKKQSKSFVMKVLNKKDPALTTVADNNKQLIADMEALSKKYTDIDFILQEKIEGGVEVSCEILYCNGKVQTCEVTFEDKKKLAGDLGSNVGCAGDCVFLVDKNTKLVKEGILKIEELLRDYEYNGFIDLNTIINKDGMWALEFTPRHGYNSALTYFQLLKKPISQFYKDALSGNITQNDFDKGYALSVRLYRDKKQRDLSIKYPKQNEDNIWLWNAYKNAKGDIMTSDFCEEICVVTAKGSTIEEARKNCYNIVEKVELLDIGYRIDIGKGISEDYNELKKMGWL